MKRTLLSLTLFGALGLAGCSDNKSQDSHDQDSMATPHHTDGEVVAEHYAMDFQVAADVQAGKSTRLSLRPGIVGKSDVDVPLDVVHDKKLHLIIVSNDLQWFAHVHPEFQTEGDYALTQTFPYGGDYLLFADYQPTGAPRRQDKFKVAVQGKPMPAVSYSKMELSSKVDGFKVKLDLPEDKLTSGSVQHIGATISQGGKMIDPRTLEDYLGAKAHVVIIGLAEKDFLHVHPEVAGEQLDLMVTFDQAGIYRAWVQFQVAGKVMTADFVLDVAAGDAGAARAGEHGHH